MTLLLQLGYLIVYKEQVSNYMGKLNYYLINTVYCVWEFLSHSKQPTYLFPVFFVNWFTSIGIRAKFFLLNSKKWLPKRTGFPQKKPDIRQHRKIKEQELGNSRFCITNPSSNTFSNKRETRRRDGSTTGKHGAINKELIG